MTGRCLCESVKVEIKGELSDTRICHCNRCRRKTGSAFHSAGFVSEENLKIKDPNGFLKAYKRNENTDNLFCSNCGSSMLGYSHKSKRYNVALGILDEPYDFVVEKEIFTEEKVSWLPMEFKMKKEDE